MTKNILIIPNFNSIKIYETFIYSISQELKNFDVKIYSIMHDNNNFFLSDNFSTFSLIDSNAAYYSENKYLKYLKYCINYYTKQIDFIINFEPRFIKKIYKTTVKSKIKTLNVLDRDILEQEKNKFENFKDIFILNHINNFGWAISQNIQSKDSISQQRTLNAYNFFNMDDYDAKKLIFVNIDRDFDINTIEYFINNISNTDINNKVILHCNDSRNAEKLNSIIQLKFPDRNIKTSVQNIDIIAVLKVADLVVLLDNSDKLFNPIIPTALSFNKQILYYNQTALYTDTFKNNILTFDINDDNLSEIIKNKLTSANASFNFEYVINSFDINTMSKKIDKMIP